MELLLFGPNIWFEASACQANSERKRKIESENAADKCSRADGANLLDHNERLACLRRLISSAASLLLGAVGRKFGANRRPHELGNKRL